MKKQIVFAESSSTVFTAKLAKALRDKGYETILVSMLPASTEEFNKAAFVKTISFNMKFMKVDFRNAYIIFKYFLSKSKEIISSIREIRKLKPYIVIGRSTPNWGCVFFKYLFRKSPFVYFPYDIRSFCYEDMEEARNAGVPKFELKAEKWCFENSDGILHKGDENELNMLDKKVLGNVNIKCPAIHFLPYCSRELIIPLNKNKLSKKDKEIHLVFVGHIGHEDSWINSIKLVLNNKIHLYLYGKTANVSDEELKNKLSGYFSEFNKSKYFHYMGTLKPGPLIKEISKYDYGIWMGYYDIYKKNITTATGNKLASHLEAGLPTIYFNNHKYIGELVNKYGIGVGINVNSPLKEILRKQNYSQLIKNIEKARKEFQVESNIPRLEKFFEKVIAYHKIRKIKQSKLI